MLANPPCFLPRMRWLDANSLAFVVLSLPCSATGANVKVIRLQHQIQKKAAVLGDALFSLG